MINIGTIALCAVIFFIFYSAPKIKIAYRNIFILSVVMELMVERGYFVQIYGQKIAYRTVCEAVLFLCAVVIALTRTLKMQRVQLYSYVICLVSLLTGWLMLIIMPTSAKGATYEIAWDDILWSNIGKQPIKFLSGMWIEIIQVIMFLTSGAIAYIIFEKEDWKFILYKTVKYTRTILLLNIGEVISKYIFHSSYYITLADLLLGETIAPDGKLRNRGGGYTLCGLTKEASHYAFVLSICFILYLAYCTEIKKLKDGDKYEFRMTRFSMVVIIGILILSMSFSVLYFGTGLALLLWIMMIEKKRKGTLRTVGIFLSILFIIALPSVVILILDSISKMTVVSGSFWGRRLLSLLEEIKVIASGTWLTASSALEWSNRVRLGSTYETLKLVIYRPVFGLGLAATSAHSAFAMLLAGCGLIGTVFYLNVFFWARNIKICDYKKSLYISYCGIYIFLNLLNSFGLRPFYENWTILLCVVFQYLAQSDNKEIMVKHFEKHKFEHVKKGDELTCML